MSATFAAAARAKPGKIELPQRQPRLRVGRLQAHGPLQCPAREVRKASCLLDRREREERLRGERVTIDGSVNLKPYVDEGTKVETNGSGTAPPDDVSYDGKSVFRVHPL